MSVVELRTRPLASAAFVAVAAAAFACAPGSSYEGLSGGTAEDAALEPPRPVYPVSVALLATRRPKLRWAEVPGATGAVVELCRTRDCAAPARTFEATGRELVVPEDLEPGFWFWRLRTIAGSKRGTKASATWEMALRGPGAAGANDAPSGAVSDLDGDGLPDLSTVGNGPSGTTVVVYFGSPTTLTARRNRTSELEDKDVPLLGDPKRPIALAGGVDMEGTGFAVLLDSTFGYPSANRGGPDTLLGGTDYFDLYPVVAPTTADQMNAPLAYDLALDFDGDGHGDAAVADVYGARIQLGRTRGVGPIVPLFGGVKAGPILAADLDADGLTDVAFAAEGGTPVRIAAGDLNGMPTRFANLAVPGAPSRAIALASGDLDGDGVPDLALVTRAEDGATQLCVFRGDRVQLVTPATCIAAPEGVAFADQITAGDFEADGRDDLVVAVTTATGRALVTAKLDGAALALGPQLGPGTGLRLTTVWPGRPGRARWAASAEGRVDVYEGLDLREQIAADPAALEGFGRALR